jgi:hypothetical protein
VCGAPVFGGDANAPKVLGALHTSKWSDCSQRTSSVSRGCEGLGVGGC